MTNPDRVIATGRFLRLVDRAGWEFAERANAGHVVAVVAITPARTLLLVEQFRAPLGRRVVELPAGLVGDGPDDPDEPMERAARRELLEETGFESGSWSRLAETPTSAGLTSEIVTFFLAASARRVGPAAGDGDEQISLHEVPLDGLDAWLDSARARGLLVDSKIYAGLHLARHRIQSPP